MTNNNPLQTKGFHPFGDMIGLNFIKLEKGYSQCVLKVTNKLMNPHKTLHGGVLYSMSDTGMGAALYPLLEPDELCATVEIKISYFKPVREGTLTCDTKVIYKGKNFSNLESEIKNGEILVGKATGTFSIFKAK
ncbi:MAG: PaaI family thioesterase [Promethearchaeota archaeon]